MRRQRCGLTLLVFLAPAGAGGIRLPTYSITGKRLVLKDDCTYQEAWSEEASDIGCQSSGLIEGEYTLGDELIQFTASDVLAEIGLDCGGGGQISGSAATDGLHEVPPPGYAPAFTP